MDSLEALERLLFLARACDYEVREHRKIYCDMLENTIKQDLELLKTIKKHLKLLGLSITCFISGNPNNEIDYEPKFEELKEWLGNEN